MLVQVWDDAIKSGCKPDCRMCTALIEICTRRGDMERALAMYREMRGSRAAALSPTVHTYTAAMRAAAEGGAWESALAIWQDMQAAGCRPSGALLPLPPASAIHRPGILVLPSCCRMRGPQCAEEPGSLHVPDFALWASAPTESHLVHALPSKICCSGVSGRSPALPSASQGGGHLPILAALLSNCIFSISSVILPPTGVPRMLRLASQASQNLHLPLSNDHGHGIAA